LNWPSAQPHADLTEDAHARLSPATGIG
jgi:hypothetical protein